MKYGAALLRDAGAEVSGHEVQEELKAEGLMSQARGIGKVVQRTRE